MRRFCCEIASWVLQATAPELWQEWKRVHRIFAAVVKCRGEIDLKRLSTTRRFCDDFDCELGFRKQLHRSFAAVAKCKGEIDLESVFQEDFNLLNLFLNLGLSGEKISICGCRERNENKPFNKSRFS
ncbi:Hypothetical predicted protein [Olea europaea subsp. europaea]|nr:Hypothetical predicted protein [Olea europaea subsp. europaea]